MAERRFGMPTGPLRILLVEDDPEDVRLLVDGLLAEQKREAFSIQHVTSLGEAIKIGEIGGIDLVVLDLGLPDSDGLDTFLKFVEAVPTVPVVVVTGHQDESYAEEAFRLGAEEFVQKQALRGSILPYVFRGAIMRHHLTRQLLTIARKSREEP